MSPKDFHQLFIKSNETEAKQKSWEMWLQMLPYMKLGHFEYVSFDQLIATQDKSEVQEDGVYVDQIGF